MFITAKILIFLSASLLLCVLISGSSSSWEKKRLMWPEECQLTAAVAVAVFAIAADAAAAAVSANYNRSHLIYQHLSIWLFVQ